MRGMPEVDGGRVAGIPSDDVAWEGRGETVELGSLSHGRRPTHISDGFPNQGRAKQLPCGGLPRKCWDTDGNESAFLQPACLGHRGHLGGGKPPTPKVITMQHAGPVAGPQWEAPQHRNMQERGGTEETADSGVRTERKEGEGLRGLRGANQSGLQFQIPGADNDGGGQRLASVGRKLGEGAEELGTAGKDPEQGRGGQDGVGDVL